MVAAAAAGIPPSTPVVAVKKKGKKRKVSKHIAESVQLQPDQSGVEITDDPRPTNATVPKKKQRIAAHVKDPDEAASYLASWHAQSGWKFNKNTQSWLIRHMYTDKISKTSFATLLDYLNSAGDAIKERIIQDATRRALRYQQHTATTSTTSAENDTSTTGPTDAEAIDEAQMWHNLSDHDKRKEYKRARKALDTLQATTP